MGYVKQDDARGDHPKLVNAGPLAAHLDEVAIYYCNRNRTDGFIPRGQIRKLVDWHGIYAGESKRESQPVDPLALAQALVDVGRWTPCKGGFEVHDYLDHQSSAEQIDRDRNAARARQSRRRSRGSNGDVTDESRRDIAVSHAPVTVPEEGRRKKEDLRATSEADASDPTNTSRTPSLPSQRQQQTVKSQPAGASDREDTQEIRGLCELLAEFLEDNGCNRPTPAQIQGWRRDVRLMVEQDGRTPEQIDAAIRWSQKHEFWRGVVLSMGKVRENWDKMRLQAQRAGGSKAEGNLAVLRSLQGGAA